MAAEAMTPPLVLLVEDEPELLTTLSRQLRRLLPYATIIATPEGTSALTQVADQPVALAVIDYFLPGSNGLTIIAALKQHSPHVRTILITASPTSAIEDEARQANVDIILPKPFLLHELALALNSVFPDEQAVG